jgi:hypothetical protein
MLLFLCVDFFLGLFRGGTSGGKFCRFGHIVALAKLRYSAHGGDSPVLILGVDYGMVWDVFWNRKNKSAAVDPDDFNNLLGRVSQIEAKLNCQEGKHEWEIGFSPGADFYARLRSDPAKSSFATLVCRHCWKTKKDAVSSLPAAPVIPVPPPEPKA